MFLFLQIFFECQRETNKIILNGRGFNLTRPALFIAPDSIINPAVPGIVSINYNDTEEFIHINLQVNSILFYNI